MKNLCNICPRKCNVNRNENLGFCKATNSVSVSKVMLHHFEEPPISGAENSIGSGAIFFANCNLKCVYCQNSEISAGGKGKEISVERLSEIFKELEDAGAYNINLVTPTHYTKQIIEALNIYRPNIPIVWNTSGYESLETIKMLNGYIDIFLTDIKYLDSENSSKYSSARDYPEKCIEAVLEMKKIQPNDVLENGLMKKGIIVRHLVLPTLTKDSLSVIDWVHKNLGNQTFFSLMSQYVPMANAKNYLDINRKISPLEYKILVNKLNELNFTNAFIQDFESAETIYTPNFSENDSGFEI